MRIAFRRRPTDHRPGGSPPACFARPCGGRAAGLFSGNVNRGRLYLRAYPERRGGSNVFHLIQHALGRPQTDLYVVGLYNLVDDLDPEEAAALDGLIEKWWDGVILRFAADHLWLLGASDDLALDSVVADIIPLGAKTPG
jgi:hypothetical protein